MYDESTNQTTSTMITQGTYLTADSNENRISWIYNLKKLDLHAELMKFNLKCNGTMVERRKRLINFVRQGRVSPLPSGKVTPPSWPKPTSTIASTSPENLQLHKWNINFNDKGDSDTFVELLEEICFNRNICVNALMPRMHDIFQEDAALWYGNNRRRWIH